jgi:putative ABC transport system substrate-binding protein
VIAHPSAPQFSSIRARAPWARQRSRGRSPGARQPGKVFRIGILSLAERSSTKIFDAFREGLRDLGYVEGQNIAIGYRLAAGDFSRLPTMAGELVRLPVDVIVIEGGAKLAQIARDATPTIPIVGALGSDPVAAGIVMSFAHPGGNITGFTGTEFSGKRVQLLKEALPAVSRVGVLWNSATPGLALPATEEATRTLGLRLRPIAVGTPGEIPAGFEAVVAGGAEALVVLPDAMFWNEGRRIVALAAQHRLPTIYEEREYANDGGLISYGRNVSENFRRAAGYVDKILKGASPIDLPIQRPTKFELVVNLETARALGLTIPQSILADEVIE